MATYNDTVSESVLNNNILTDSLHSWDTNANSIALSDSFTFSHYILNSIIESIYSYNTIISPFNVNELLVDTNVLTDTSIISFNHSLSEVLVSIDNLVYNISLNESIINSLSANNLVTTRISAVNTILDIILALDSVDNGYHINLVENITLSNTLDYLVKLLNSVLETIVSSDDTSNINNIKLFTSSIIDINSGISSTSILSSLVNEQLLIRLGGSLNSSYIAYLLSPETNSVSNYNNYNFVGCTKFNDKYLFVNNTGLYEYGGYTDNGNKIVSEIQTVAFNFNSSNLKQVPSIYLGVSNTSTFVLKVRVDGKGEVLYKLNRHTTDLQTQKVDIGKGLIGRYFQFEVVTDASEFNLESIDFYPIEIKRKI